VSITSSPGSENRTRFFVRCGVAGGVAIPCGLETAGCTLDRASTLGPMQPRRFLRTAMGRSSLTILS
jgi:hypothetical protein